MPAVASAATDTDALVFGLRHALHQPLPQKPHSLPQPIPITPIFQDRTPAPGQAVGDAAGAVGENIEFAVARQELDPDPRPGVLPGLREEVFLQSGQAALGRADEVLDRESAPASREPSAHGLDPWAAPPRSGCCGPSARPGAPCRTAARSAPGSPRKVVLSAVLPAQHLVGQRQPRGVTTKACPRGSGGRSRPARSPAGDRASSRSRRLSPSGNPADRPRNRCWSDRV